MGILSAMGKAAVKEVKRSVARRKKAILKQHSIPRSAPKGYQPKKTRRKKKLPATSRRKR
jgi:hypothetical protein